MLGLGLGQPKRPGGGEGGGLLLDNLIVQPSAAYSVRKLRTAYAGSAIRVRRSSDNSEQDIGFASNELDTTALLAFVGANNGFVASWYDQTGNARHATQATAAAQPQIVAAGVVNVLNTKPVFRFLNVGLGTIIQLPAFKFAEPGTNWGFAGIGAVDSLGAPPNRNIMGTDGNGYQQNGIYVGLGTGQVTANVNLNTAGASTIVASGGSATAGALQAIATLANSANDVTVYLNGTAGTTVTGISWVTGNQSNFQVGGYQNGSGNNDLSGYWGELLVWRGASLSSDRATVQTNQKAYWGTP